MHVFTLQVIVDKAICWPNRQLFITYYGLARLICLWHNNCWTWNHEGHWKYSTLSKRRLS